MVQTHWKEFFPAIAWRENRAGAIHRLLRLVPALATNEPTDASASAVVAAWDALDGLARELKRNLASEQTTLDVLIREPQSYKERATGAIATAIERAAEAMQAAEQAPDPFAASGCSTGSPYIVRSLWHG
jgi:hypothetical protein